MLYLKNGLWWAFGFHTAWNFSPSILFGLPNSGKSFPYSVVRWTPKAQPTASPIM